MPVSFSTLCNDVYLPVRSNDGFGGYEVYTVDEITVKPRRVVTISTKVTLLMHDSLFARVADLIRCISSNVIILGSNVSTQRGGEICVTMFNKSDCEYSISAKTAFCKLVVDYHPPLFIRPSDIFRNNSRSRRNRTRRNSFYNL